MLNSCALVGRIATDPELKHTTSGTAVCNFRLAVERARKADGQPDADFIDVVAFGKSAEFVAEYLDKGALVGVTGRIQARQWQALDGTSRRAVEVVADTVQALESKHEAERRRAAKSAGAAAPAPAPAPGPAPAPMMDDVPVDDDPFADGV